MKIKIDDYQITAFIQSHFRLDGGAMFGSIPKNLWSKKIPADNENCIPLVARSLLIEYKNKKILVDTGLGKCFSKKEQQIFNINNLKKEDLPYKADEITDLILTHLHFDHAGDISYKEKDAYLPMFKNATHHIQRTNVEYAKAPKVKEAASYRENIVSVLDKINLNELNGDTELFPNLFLNVVNGHTKGQQIITIKGEDDALYFPSDLMPTSHHFKLPYCMGYDICSGTVLEEKETFLNEVNSKKGIIVFQHDSDIESIRIS